MAIPTDLPYCLVYPTCYIRDVDPDHFDTHNNLAGMCLHRCVCHATLQFSNDEPKECTNYARSHLILPHGAQYNDWLFLAILEPQNHHGALIDSMMGEPYPMEMVGDFWAMDPIFKGCYEDSLLYSNTDLHQLRWLGFTSLHSRGRSPCHWPQHLTVESSIYRRWHPKQGRLSPFVRRSGHLGLCPRC